MDITAIDEALIRYTWLIFPFELLNRKREGELSVSTKGAALQPLEHPRPLDSENKMFFYQYFTSASGEGLEVSFCQLMD